MQPKEPSWDWVPCAISPRTETEWVLSAIVSLWFVFNSCVLVLVFKLICLPLRGLLEAPRGWALERKWSHVTPSPQTHTSWTLPIGMRRVVCPLPPHPRYNPLGTKVPSEQKSYSSSVSHFSFKTVSAGLEGSLQLLTSVCLLWLVSCYPLPQRAGSREESRGRKKRGKERLISLSEIQTYLERLLVTAVVW